MIVADTSGLIAALNRVESMHQAVSQVIAEEQGPLLVSPFVLAELDYLVLSRWGIDAEIAMIEMIRTTCELVAFDEADLTNAAQIVRRYADHKVGLADASLVVLAQRHRTNRILTLDRRHFRVLRGPGGKPFRILPDEL